MDKFISVVGASREMEQDSITGRLRPYIQQSTSLIPVTMRIQFNDMRYF